jgi:DNA-binding response OmpR family regulator
MNILIIEDDIVTSEAVRLSLEIFIPDFRLTVAEKGCTGLDKIRKEQFDIVILDLGLPDMDGLDVLRQLRLFSQIPVLVASARHDPDVITSALKTGAHDYVLKPFNIQVFIRSIKDLTNPEKPSEPITDIINITSRFMINKEPRQAKYNGTIVEISEKEWQVLNCLVAHWGRLVTVKNLSEVMSLTDYHIDQPIHDTINNLRKKMGDDLYLPKIILAEFGCGYRLVKPRI